MTMIGNHDNCLPLLTFLNGNNKTVQFTENFEMEFWELQSSPPIDTVMKEREHKIYQSEKVCVTHFFSFKCAHCSQCLVAHRLITIVGEMNPESHQEEKPAKACSKEEKKQSGFIVWCDVS